jgi:hypothetical protein
MSALSHRQRSPPPHRPRRAPSPSRKRSASRSTGVVSRQLDGGQQRQGRDRKDAGKIEDLLLDHRGHVGYAVVSFGGFLGIGDKLFAVPWDAVIADREKRIVYIDVKKETLERSPSFSSDKWPDPNDGEWGRDVRKAWSDASITAAVKTRLAGTSPSTLLKVDVDTTNGIVQLNGTVDSDKTRQRATELARQVDGVRRVVNNLKVQG